MFDDRILSGDGAVLPCSSPRSETVAALPELILAKRQDPEVLRFTKLVKALPGIPCATLIVRLETTVDPLMLWALHCHLDNRGVLPSLRWPMNESSPQMEYVTWLGDLMWFCKRHPEHVPTFRGWNGLFRNAVGTPAWHATAYRQYLFVAARYSLAHWCSKGLGLSSANRCELMTLPTASMKSDRRQLQPVAFSSTTEALLAYAISHPDKSGRHDPNSIANRRAAMWRTFILSGRNKAAAAKVWNLIADEDLSRQAFSKQVEAVTGVLRAAKL